MINTYLGFLHSIFSCFFISQHFIMEDIRNFDVVFFILEENPRRNSEADEKLH